MLTATTAPPSSETNRVGHETAGIEAVARISVPILGHRCTQINIPPRRGNWLRQGARDVNHISSGWLIKCGFLGLPLTQKVKAAMNGSGILIITAPSGARYAYRVGPLCCDLDVRRKHCGLGSD